MSLVNSWPSLSVQVGEGTEQLPFGNPNRRRVWLLSKALECHALSEALELAKIAERFICGGRPRVTDRVAESAVAFPCVDELAVLASVEEIVRYLKQSDDTPSDGTIPEGGALSAQSYDDLLAHANQRRLRHHLPPFQLRPTIISETNDAQQHRIGDSAVIPPLRKKGRDPGKIRAPSRRERAAWARQVVALAE